MHTKINSTYVNLSSSGHKFSTSTFGKKINKPWADFLKFLLLETEKILEYRRFDRKTTKNFENKHLVSSFFFFDKIVFYAATSMS